LGWDLYRRVGRSGKCSTYFGLPGDLEGGRERAGQGSTGDPEKEVQLTPYNAKLSLKNGIYVEGEAGEGK